MNRFRTKKRAKEVVDPARASPDSDVPVTKPPKTSIWGRKNSEPVLKQEVDLPHALPSTDDFRTSLLMNGLSARFSMLREQDDPNSKLGKASDDSVLFSKRQSRLDNYGGLTGLSDIAEVSSSNGSIRPPFAFSKTESYSTGDGYGTDDDSSHGASIMSRAKPGEGNNLFGGRQKIYKIPLRKGGEVGAGMGGKALYESDVSQSAFQKLRERERQLQREAEEREEQNQIPRTDSPPLTGYNRNRETSSSTSSGGPAVSRSSTAATSVTSQRPPSINGSRTPNSIGPIPSGNIERSTTKARRLYDTGLDQHLHDQQSSAISRIDTLTRQRTLGSQTPPPSLHSPVSASSTSDRWDRPQVGAKASMPNLRTISPTYGPGTGKFDFKLKTENLHETRSPFGLASPPLSPQVSDNGDQSVISTLPNDRGKATAMGAFSRPVQPYDENKYTQRQLQLQRGRERSPRKNIVGSRQESQARSRAESNASFASARSRSNSSAQRQYQPHDWTAQSPVPSSTAPAEQTPSMGSFLNLDNGDDVRVRERSRSRGRSPIDPVRIAQALNVEKPLESDHPAIRLQQSRSEPDLGLTPSKSSMGPLDSPTLGPTGGLSSIVRAHLRTDSNSSSIYGAASADLVSRFPTDPMEPISRFDYSSQDNAWDINDWSRDSVNYDRGLRLEVPMMPPPRHSEESPIPISATLTNNHSADQDSRRASWERELDAHGNRDGRNENHREADFHHELASRRRRVQENLKSFAETESRSASPLPDSDMSNDAQPVKINRLGMLKSKTSRSSLVLKSKDSPPNAKQLSQAKAMKMLGIGNATMNSSPSPSKQNFDESPSEEQDPGKPRTRSKTDGSDQQIKSFRQARRDAQRNREKQVALRHQQARIRGEANHSGWTNFKVDEMRQRYEAGDAVYPRYQPGQRSPSRERRAPPPTASSQRSGNSFESRSSERSGSRPSSRNNRDRSGSDTSGSRSKSRNGRYRDDLAKAMAEGTGTLGQGVLEDLHSARYMPKSPANPAMVFNTSRSASPMLGNRASKSAASGYFDMHKPPKLQISEGGDIGLSPRPSPVTPFAVNTTPSLPGSNTPTAPGFQSQGRIPEHLKKNINKHDISEPTLVSSTSRMTTVNLPPGASLQNGIESAAPPIPAVNPRRRQTRAMFGMSKKEDHTETSFIPVASQSTEEMSSFSDDEDPKSRKLRKSTSEGGNMAARARQAAITTPSPAMPTFTIGAGGAPHSAGLMENGMF